MAKGEHLADSIERLIDERNRAVLQLAIAKGTLEALAEWEGAAGVIARTTLDEMEKQG